MKARNDAIIRFFEDAGYYNVEVIEDRLLFTSGEEVYNWSINEAKNYIKEVCKEGCSWVRGSKECVEVGCPVADWDW